MLGELKNKFPFSNISIPTGTLFNDACSALSVEPKRRKYSDSLYALGEADSILGVDVVGYEMDCFGREGPLRSVEYFISPSYINSKCTVDFQKLFTTLEISLGQASERMGEPLIEMTKDSGSVKANAYWRDVNYYVYLCIFGGERTHPYRQPHVGALHFTWTDEVAASKAYLRDHESYVASLELENISLDNIKTFKIKIYENHRKTTSLASRDAQRVLSQSMVFETPDAIKHVLESQASSLAFTSLASGSVLVSNAIDSAVIKFDEDNFPFCENILPAKGKGCMFLSISGVSIQTDHSSRDVVALMDWLKKTYGVETKYHESYDC